jgi:hypothetical protein
LTKCDKIKAKPIKDRYEQLKNLIANCRFAIDVLPYSSINDLGRSELMGIIKKYTKETNVNL